MKPWLNAKPRLFSLRVSQPPWLRGAERISLEPCCSPRGTLVPVAARVALAMYFGQWCGFPRFESPPISITNKTHSGHHRNYYITKSSHAKNYGNRANRLQYIRNEYRKCKGIIRYLYRCIKGIRQNEYGVN